MYLHVQYVYTTFVLSNDNTSNGYVRIVTHPFLNQTVLYYK